MDNWKIFCWLNNDPKVDPEFELLLDLKLPCAGDGFLELNPNSPITAESASDSLSAFICRSRKS